MKFTRAICVITFSAAVVACGHYSPETAPRAVSYNRAIGEASNDILLLNIVRSSQRQPRYFSRLGSNSAQSTFNPTLGITIPLNGLSAMDAAAQIVATPQGTVQNLLTIDNLDDKKYMQGAVEELSVSRLDHFISQGFQRDLLGLLFFQSISIPANELPTLRTALATYCEQHVNSYCGSDASLAATDGLNADSCWDPHITPARTASNGVEYITFVNDPALEDLDVPNSPHPEFCFQVVLRGLLALGLRSTDEDTVEDVDEGIPTSVVYDPDFRAEMIKLGYKVVADEKTAASGISKSTGRCSSARNNRAVHCVHRRTTLKIFARRGVGTSRSTFRVTKKSSDKALILDPLATRLVRTAPDFRHEILLCGGSDHQNKENEKVCKKSQAEYQKDVEEDARTGKPIALGDLKIHVQQRSFEGMVYYLGEVVRAQEGQSGAARPYRVLVLGREPWDPVIAPSSQPGGAKAGSISRYEELLFDLRSTTPSDAIFEVADDAGVVHWIPGFCVEEGLVRTSAKDAAGKCSIEYPNHETLVVLTVLNQLWALQKEPSEEPLKTVTVGGSGG